MTTGALRTTIPFSRGVPPLELIPANELAAIAETVLEEHPDTIFQYAPLGHNKGDEKLRRELGKFHGVDAEEIFVGNGSLQVLDLLACHFSKNGVKTVFVEVPTYDRALQIFNRYGARIIGLPLQKDGIDVDALLSRLEESTPALLYIIPDFQNPSGVTTSEEKRKELIDITERFPLTVIEDIPYRELRYHGITPPLLRKIARRKDRVITVGSLTKILSPGLRIGYALSDEQTAFALAGLAEGTYLSPSPFCHAVAARALADGLMESTVNKAKAILAPRHDAAVAYANALLGDSLIAVPDGGYFLGVYLPATMDEETLICNAREEGIMLTSGSAFYPERRCSDTVFLRLPFHALHPVDFAEGLERLIRVAAN